VIDEYGSSPEEQSKIISDYNELLTYFHAVVERVTSISPSIKEKVINALPNNGQYFRDIGKGDSQQNSEFHNNY
jgi:hypothetical protein